MRSEEERVVDARNFINRVAAGDLHLALEPMPPPAGPGACATHDPRRFASPERQQAAFDGEPTDPKRDYLAARLICLDCPILAACGHYAEGSREEHTFLAGLTPDQRRTRRRKHVEIAKRRLQVDALRALGAPTLVIADLVGRDPSLVRADLRALNRHAHPEA
jgi:hypothetical protein